MRKTFHYIATILFFCLGIASLQAQQYLDPEYIKVTEQRAAKIVDDLAITSNEEKQEVIQIIAQQYQQLSKIQDERDEKIAALKKASTDEKKISKKTEKIKEKASKSMDKLHAAYIQQLAKHLSEKEVDAVKDGMTYGVLPKTYQAFQEMIPSLTAEEKQTIYSYLSEAREKAMDGGSSKEKHAWFGKYKGKINNYLSARGYDLEKERNAWYDRIEAAKKK